MFPTRGVLKEFTVKAEDLSTRLYPVYYYITTAGLDHCISIVAATVEHLDFDFRSGAPPALAPGSHAHVTLTMKPVGCAVDARTTSDVHTCVTHVLTFLEGLHGAGFCHRDIRVDNVIRCDRVYKVIDLELADFSGQRVFWESDALPPSAKTGPYVFAHDLWQVGSMIDVLLREVDVTDKTAHVDRFNMMDLLASDLKKGDVSASDALVRIRAI